MGNRRVQTFLVSGLFMLCLLAAPAAWAGPVPTADELLKYLGIDKKEKQKLMAGEIVTTPTTEGSEKELAVGIVMFVPVPIEKLVDFVQSGQTIRNDKDVVSFGELKPGATLTDFSGVAFKDNETDEAKALLDATWGSKFNLSPDEIKLCKAAKPPGKGNEPARTAASQVYRQMLLARFESFRQRGLAGIPEYDRGKKTSSPESELRIALKESELFNTHFPELQKALLEYPANQPTDVKHRFFWINQTVEKRPTFILTHRMGVVRAEGALMVEQQYYVGHSYNSMQVISGAIPVPGGTLVFHSNHTSTDQVAGLGSGLKRSIGRGQMREETIRGFETMRAAVKAK